jgi:hypothetical protein
VNEATMRDADEVAPPVTGNAAIDEALAAVDTSGPVFTHHEQLARAHDVVQRVLNAERP